MKQKNSQRRRLVSKIVNVLPARHGDPDGVFPSEIIGATITRIGQPVEYSVDGGGLAIEYLPAGSTESRQLVLAFNELGMWIKAPESLRRRR